MKSRKIDSAEALVGKAEKDKKVQKLIGKKTPGTRGRPKTKKDSTTESTKGGDAKVQEPEPASEPVMPEQGDGGENATKGRGITWADADTQLINFRLSSYLFRLTYSHVCSNPYAYLSLMIKLVVI